MRQRLLAALLLVYPGVVAQPPTGSDDRTACDTCTDPLIQKTGWWHGVGLNCPTGGDAGDCDICTPRFGNSPEVVKACQTAATEAACCQICTMWNDRRLPGGLLPGNDRLCASWYWRKAADGAPGGWCGLKDCAGPGQCGESATSPDFISGPACGTKAVGWAFASAILGALAVYVTGGTLYGWQVEGKWPHWDAHPHHPRWISVGGLVLDGVAFAASGGERRPATKPSSGAAAPPTERLLAAGEPQGRQSPKKKGREKGKDEENKKDKKEKKEKRPKASGPGEINGVTSAQQQQEQGQQSSAAAAAAPTASGGGGRWVHLPTQ